MRAETPTLYPNTNAVFSPDDKYVITGAGAVTKGGNGKLLLLQKDNLEVVKALEIGATPVRVFWHSKINQVSHVITFDGEFTHGVRITDCHRPLKRPDMCAVLARNVTQWRQITAQQGTS